MYTRTIYQGWSLRALAVVLLLCATAAHGAYFYNVGFLSVAGYDLSEALALSADGTVVVGYSAIAGSEDSTSVAFKWTIGGGIEDLGVLPGGGISQAYAASGDGQIIVGASTPPPPDILEAVRWVNGQANIQGTVGGPTPIGNLNPAFVYSSALATNVDGSVAVGWSFNGSFATEAYRWTSGGGMVGLGSLGGTLFHSEARGVSTSGNKVVGHSINGEDKSEAFVWTPGGGMVGLGSLAGGVNFASQANAISADGTVVVGETNVIDNTMQHAFLWRDIDNDGQVDGNEEMTSLGDLPGGADESSALAVSAGGEVVVGYGTDASGKRAFIWTPSIGIVDLKDYLLGPLGHLDLGVDLTNWTLTEATSVVESGGTITIAGKGINPSQQAEGWVVSFVPEPASMLLLALGVLVDRRRRRA